MRGVRAKVAASVAVVGALHFALAASSYWAGQHMGDVIFLPQALGTLVLLFPAGFLVVPMRESGFGMLAQYGVLLVNSLLFAVAIVGAHLWILRRRSRPR